MYTSKNSLVHWLREREIGFTNKLHQQKFIDFCSEIAEDRLVSKFQIKEIKNVTESIRSSYVCSCNNQSHAAITHTNRTISIIDLDRMENVKVLNSKDRTIWTIAYHPLIPNLLVTGSVGGQVTVYEDYNEVATIQERSGDAAQYGNIIPSVCFHPINNWVLYASRTAVKIWDWRNNEIVHSLTGNLSIRFMRFNTLNNMLITIQNYNKYQTKNCANRILDVIGATSLVLNTAFHPSCVQDSIYELVNGLVDITFGCVCISGCDSDDFCKKKNFNRMMLDLNTTADMLLRKLEDISPDCLQITDSFRTNHFYTQLLEYSTNCKKMNEFYQKSFVLFIDKCERPIKVALQLCLDSSWDHPMLKYLINVPHDRITPIYKEKITSPKILQVWDFETIPDLSQSWYASITQCESHNDVSVDISKCGKKIAIFYRKVDDKHNNYSRLSVFSLERKRLGKLLHNIVTKLACCQDFIGVSFSPSSKYLLMVVRQDVHVRTVSYIGVHRLDENVVYSDKSSLIQQIDNNVGFVKWGPRSGDRIIFGFSTHNLSYWSY